MDSLPVVSQMDSEVLHYTNEFRTNPKSAIPHLEDMKKKFTGKIMKRAGKVDLRTNEGITVVQELIDFLNKQAPLLPQVWNNSLALAARDHVVDTGPSGLTGHDGTNGSTMSSRISKYGQTQGWSGENISYGQDSGLEVVLQLMIDDGVSSRGHRTNIFNANFKVMGSHSGAHKTYGTQTVIDYASGVSDGASGTQQSVGSSAAHSTGGHDMQSIMDEFMAQEVTFDMPPNFASYSENTEVKMEGNKMTKIVTRTIKMANGGTSTMKKTITKTVS